MSSLAMLQPEPAALRACTIARDVQNFDLLINDRKIEIVEAWGDLTCADAALFLTQPDADRLDFVVLAIDAEDKGHLAEISDLIRQAKTRAIRVLIVADRIALQPADAARGE